MKHFLGHGQRVAWLGTEPLQARRLMKTDCHDTKHMLTIRSETRKE